MPKTVGTGAGSLGLLSVIVFLSLLLSPSLVELHEKKKKSAQIPMKPEFFEYLY
jgi:hypothetical protein